MIKIPPQNQEQQQAAEPKFNLFKISEWPQFVWNWFWRLPGIEKFRVGRARVGERMPPIWYELRKTWIPKNTTWFGSKLQKIEDFWAAQGKFYGTGTDETGEDSLLGNPDGVVRFYVDLGIYSDIERVNTEVDWFLVGTGYFEENLRPKIPTDPNEWRIRGWTNEENVRKAIGNLEVLRDLRLLKKVSLYPGTVYHEGKKEYEEELYCFGHTNAVRLAKRIATYDEQLNKQLLQDYRVEVLPRTESSNAARALQELINKIAEIEEETFNDLSTLRGKLATYDQKWDDMVTKLSPEAQKVGVIRFPHTYIIIKQYAIVDIEEKIDIRDREVYDAIEDKEGNEIGRRIRDKYTQKRKVIMRLKQEKNIYEEEKEDLKKRMNELKKILDEGQISKETEEAYKSRMKMDEQRLVDIEQNITNKANLTHDTTPQINPNDFWQRQEELGYGLDENGYPLEINPTTGEVLIDRWWNELGQNKWHLKTIALKPGGADVLKKHLGVDVEYFEGKGDEDDIDQDETKLRAKIIGNPSRPIRKIKDERFHGRVDLLELGHIIYSYWDSVRDDLRDGRFHPHSKSVADYVIEASGGFDEQLGAPYPKGWYTARSKGIGVTRRGTIPLGPTGINIDVSKKEVLRDAIPKIFEKVPEEERAIKRDYRMKMADGSFSPPEENGKIVLATRKPSKYNPAFDRRAENIEYVHWGRMYYYEWISYVNRWSENPFPHISTRGIALFIAHLVATDVWNYKDAEDALEGNKFDYGVRGMGMYGEVNPSSGKGILQEN